MQMVRLHSKQVVNNSATFLQGQSTVFLISDSQLKDESFLEDINNILDTGEVCLRQPCRASHPVVSQGLPLKSVVHPHSTAHQP